MFVFKSVFNLALGSLKKARDLYLMCEALNWNKTNGRKQTEAKGKEVEVDTSYLGLNVLVYAIRKFDYTYLEIFHMLYQKLHLFRTKKQKQRT